MSDRFRAIRLFRDDTTRLVVPNKEIIATDALTNIVSSYVTNPIKDFRSWFSYEDIFGNNPFETWDQGIRSLVTRIADNLTIGLGVTKITSQQEYVMPFSKGIGSTGEVIHLLGAKNEIINLEFITDDYPGRLSHIIKNILRKVLETAEVVYLIDDMFLATPCLIRKTKLNKQGSYRGAIMGEIELVSLTTGGDFMKDILETSYGKNISSFISKLSNSVSSVLSNNPTLVSNSITAGKIIISGALIGAILGYSGV